MYEYRFVVVDTSDHASVPSAAQAATPLDHTAPALPAGMTAPEIPPALTATGVDGGVSCAWGSVEALDLAGYRRSRAPAASGPYAPLNSGAQLTNPASVDASGTLDPVHHYRAVTVDTDGNESAPGAVASAAPLDRSTCEGLPAALRLLPRRTPSAS